MDLQAMEFAHDLKMPIQLIYSCVQLLEMELAPNARAEGYLQMLLRSADQLQSMVRSALDGGPRCGETLRLQRMDVAAVARDVSRQCALFARGKGVDLRFQANAAEFFMFMDGEKLERILHNLISNALRFTPEGGHVLLLFFARGDAVDFTVEDSGCGISPTNQARVFDLGVSDGGDGYGLSIVRQYARMLGGNVYVQSTPGRGACFTVHLPVKNTQAG